MASRAGGQPDQHGTHAVCPVRGRAGPAPHRTPNQIAELDAHNWICAMFESRLCWIVASTYGRVVPLLRVYTVVIGDMSAKVSPKKRKGVPDWARDPFEHFLDEADRLRHIVRLSSAGISMIRATPKVIEALMKVKADNATEESQRLEHARRDADLAEREVKSGFPILHAWAVVALWALFEAMIRTFVAEWLKHKRTAWRTESIQRLRIKLGEYESIPRNQRHRFVVEMLEKELGAGLRDGVTRFEAMLEPFGLSGELPASLRREIYELGQVRNLIAHNFSKVDRRFADACPWLEVKIGDEFYVSRDMFERYNYVIIAYVTLIICRLGEHFGVDMSDERFSILEEIEKRVSKPVDKPKG